jgi:hypothetical protein
MTFVFVHIAKTAGTSFRYALERTHPGEIVYDYGDPGAATPFIHKLIYGGKVSMEERAAKAAAQVREAGSFALAGHFPAARYWGHFPAGDFMTFVRDPVERALSHFDHHTSYLAEEMTFERFLEGEGTNLQSKILADVDLEAFGLVGVTEHYRASLRLLEREMGLKVPFLRRNLRRSPLRWLRRKRPPVPRTKALIEAAREANLDDKKLYDELAARFRARYKEAFGREAR